MVSATVGLSATRSFDEEAGLLKARAEPLDWPGASNIDSFVYICATAADYRVTPSRGRQSSSGIIVEEVASVGLPPRDQHPSEIYPPKRARAVLGSFY